jgi:predicted Zn-dependent protease
MELGRQAADDISKSVEFVHDEEQLAKLQAMLDEIAAVTDRPEIRYRPYIVAAPYPNAFTIPGGWVYVTTGLLEGVESDHELAGVLAHEIAHNVNQHAIERMRDTPKGLGLLQLASIAALIIGRSPEAAVLAGAAANHITASVLHGSSVAAEVEADAHGLEYLTRTQYDPTGFLTFLESRDRVRAARDQLEALGVPVHRRLVTHAPQPESRAVTVDGEQVTEMRYDGERLALLAGHDSARADGLVATLGWRA